MCGGIVEVSVCAPYLCFKPRSRDGQGSKRIVVPCSDTVAQRCSAKFCDVEAHRISLQDAISASKDAKDASRLRGSWSSAD